ncbi:hypothetical protein [Streptomyces albireticuli]|uniref:hypothetical protein n=1 Tax=Streptomyces albireticuli TaxID=1940 RepID=UPI0036CB88B7
MTSPPPPNPPQPPGHGGGFGPPQNFGPPQPPAQPYGNPYGRPQPQQGFGQYGQFAPPVPPPPSGGNGAKVAAIVVAAVLVAGLIVGGVILTSGGDDDGPSPRAKSSPSPSVSSAAPSEAPSATPSSPSDAPSGFDPSGSADPSSPSVSRVPYVVLKPGQCFDHPHLSSGVTRVTTRSCDSSHDGEVIGNATLSGTFTTEMDIQAKAKDLCESKAQARVRSIADGRTYYSYTLYPAKSTYDRGQSEVTCTITRSTGPGGAKLTEALPE